MQFHNLFILNKEIHSDNTRQVSDIHDIPYSTKAQANSIRFIGTELWNLLNSEIITSPSINVVKETL